MRSIIKHILAGVLSVAVTISSVPIVLAHAEESFNSFTYTTDNYSVTYCSEANKDCIIQIMNQSPLLTAVKQYD